MADMRKMTAGGAVLAAVIALALPVVQHFEGRSLVAYRDIVGVATICDGETRGVKMGDTATDAECDAMTEAAVAQFEAAIRPCLPADLPTETRAAFVVTAYNIGAGAFCKSTMARKANAGDLRGACDALLLWNKAGGQVVRGLDRRRQAERALCLRGVK